jgi:hypothetical protein
MNLHSIVSPIVGAVNTNQLVTLKQDIGFITNADFSRSPAYTQLVMAAQIQGLSSDNIRLLNGLGIQGERRRVYLWGTWTGLVRSLQKGNDLIVFVDGSVWKVAVVLEDYGHGVSGASGWCSVAVVLQNPVSEDYGVVAPPPSPPAVIQYVKLDTMTSYTLPDGMYQNQRVGIKDDLFLASPDNPIVVSGKIDGGTSITINIGGTALEFVWDVVLGHWMVF